MHVVLTIDSKLAILDRLKGGSDSNKSCLMNIYVIGTSTVGEIKKDEAKIRSFASTMDGMAMRKKGYKAMHLSNNDMKNIAKLRFFTSCGAHINCAIMAMLYTHWIGNQL